jgi:hypothetical protein
MVIKVVKSAFGPYFSGAIEVMLAAISSADDVEAVGMDGAKLDGFDSDDEGQEGGARLVPLHTAPPPVMCTCGAPLPKSRKPSLSGM